MWGLNYVKQISEVDSLAEDMDLGGVEQVSVDIGSTANEEMSSADGKDLAHGVSAMENSVLIKVGCPHEIMLLDMLDNDNIIGNAFQQFRKLLIEATFLPDTPQHPLMPESGKIGPDVVLVFSL